MLKYWSPIIVPALFHTDAPMSVNGSDGVLVLYFWGSGNVALAGAALCGQDREGPLRVEGEVGLRARFRCCRRPFPASPLPHPACPFQGTGRSTCLSRRSAAAGGGCWFRGPGGRDVAAAVAVARHGDAGGAGEHDLPLSEPPAFAAEAAFHLWHPEPVPALVLASRPAHQPAPRVVVDRADHGLGHSVPEVVRPSRQRLVQPGEHLGQGLVAG